MVPPHISNELGCALLLDNILEGPLFFWYTNLPKKQMGIKREAGFLICLEKLFLRIRAYEGY
jgi:hypothetical protein